MLAKTNMGNELQRRPIVQELARTAMSRVTAKKSTRDDIRFHIRAVLGGVRTYVVSRREPLAQPRTRCRPAPKPACIVSDSMTYFTRITCVRLC